MSLDPEDPTYVQWVLTAYENAHALNSGVTQSSLRKGFPFEL